MERENWNKVIDRYYSPEDRARWAERMEQVPGDFDQQAYNRQWTDLAGRIEAALPLDPASAEAQAFHDEWMALLKPFSNVATPQMMAEAKNLYDRMDEWKDVKQPPFSMEVWQFIQAVCGARR